MYFRSYSVSRIRVLIVLFTIVLLSVGVPFTNFQNGENLSSKLRASRSLSQYLVDELENTTPDNKIDSKSDAGIVGKHSNSPYQNQRSMNSESSVTFDISEEIENKFRRLKELQGRRKLGTLPIDTSPEKYEAPVKKPHQQGRLFKGRSFTNNSGVPQPDSKNLNDTDPINSNLLDSKDATTESYENSTSSISPGSIPSTTQISDNSALSSSPGSIPSTTEISDNSAPSSSPGSIPSTTEISDNSAPSISPGSIPSTTEISDNSAPSVSPGSIPSTTEISDNSAPSVSPGSTPSTTDVNNNSSPISSSSLNPTTTDISDNSTPSTASSSLVETTTEISDSSIPRTSSSLTEKTTESYENSTKSSSPNSGTTKKAIYEDNPSSRNTSKLTPEELKAICNRTYINIQNDEYYDDEFKPSMCEELSSTTSIPSDDFTKTDSTASSPLSSSTDFSVKGSKRSNENSKNCTDTIFLDLEDDPSTNDESKLPICPDKSTATTETPSSRKSSKPAKVYIDLSTLSSSDSTTSSTTPVTPSSTGSDSDETSECPNCSTKIYIDLDNTDNDDDTSSTSEIPKHPSKKTRTSKKPTKKSKQTELYTESAEPDYAYEPYFFDYLTEYYLHGGLRGRSGYIK